MRLNIHFGFIFFFFFKEFTPNKSVWCTSNQVTHHTDSVRHQDSRVLEHESSFTQPQERADLRTTWFHRAAFIFNKVQVPTDKYLTLTETEVVIPSQYSDNIPFATALSIQHAYVQTRYWHWQAKAKLGRFLTTEDVNFIDALASICFSYVLRRGLLTEDAVTWRFWEHNTNETSSNENTKSKLIFYVVSALVHACCGAEAQTGAVLSVKAKSSSKEAVSGLQKNASLNQSSHTGRIHITPWKIGSGLWRIHQENILDMEEQRKSCPLLHIQG